MSKAQPRKTLVDRINLEDITSRERYALIRKGARMSNLGQPSTLGGSGGGGGSSGNIGGNGKVMQYDLSNFRVKGTGDTSFSIVTSGDNPPTDDRSYKALDYGIFRRFGVTLTGNQNTVIGGIFKININGIDTVVTSAFPPSGKIVTSLLIIPFVQDDFIYMWLDRTPSSPTDFCDMSMQFLIEWNNLP